MVERGNTKSIGVNVIWNGLLSLTSILFPIITFPYITRVLGVEANGAISFASSVINYFALFATLGLSTYGVKACAEVKNDRTQLSKVTHELLIISCIAAIIVLLVLYVSLLLILQFRDYKMLMAVYSVNIILNVLGMNWMYQGIEKFRYITARSVIFKMVSIVMMFLFVKEAKDVVIYAGISVFATGAGNILNILYSCNYIDYMKFPGYDLKRHIKPILILFATTLAINIYSHLDTVMLGLFHGDYATGIYSVAVKVKTILITLISSFSVVIMSRISYVNHNKDGDIFSILKKSYSLIIMITIPIVAYFMLLAKESVIFLSGMDFIESSVPMQILMPTVAISSISQIIGSQYSVSTGKEKNLMIAVICGACVNVMFNAILIPRFSYNGAAIGTVIAESTQCLIQMALAKEIVTQVFLVKKIIIICIGTFSAIIATIVFSHFFTIPVAFFVLLSNAIVFFTVYFLVIFILKYDMCLVLFRLVKNKLMR